MKRREFCRATVTAAAIATVPGSQLLSAMTQELTNAVSDIPAIDTSGGEHVLKRTEIEDHLRRTTLATAADLVHVANGSLTCCQPASSIDSGLLQLG